MRIVIEVKKKKKIWNLWKKKDEHIDLNLDSNYKYARKQKKKKWDQNSKFIKKQKLPHTKNVSILTSEHHQQCFIN